MKIRFNKLSRSVGRGNGNCVSDEFVNENTDENCHGLIGENLLKYQLEKALDIISAQASTIKMLNDDRDLQCQQMNDFVTENKELIADIQELIEENKNLLEELEFVRKQKGELHALNERLECDNFMLLEELEINRLGWISKFEVEELKRITQQPLLQKLEESRQETKRLEDHMRFLDAERDSLLDELTCAREKISSLLTLARNEKQARNSGQETPVKPHLKRRVTRRKNVLHGLFSQVSSGNDLTDVNPTQLTRFELLFDRPKKRLQRSFSCKSFSTKDDLFHTFQNDRNKHTTPCPGQTVNDYLFEGGTFQAYVCTDHGHIRTINDTYYSSKQPMVSDVGLNGKSETVFGRKTNFANLTETVKSLSNGSLIIGWDESTANTATDTMS